MGQNVTAIYFSPTGGTRTYARAVAAAMAEGFGELDLTRPQVRRERYSFGKDQVVVLAVPVYYGRVPEVPGLLDGLTGDGTPAVLLAVYGNRHIDDALVELEDMCRARGFVPVSGGAFVAPHTLSARIGAGRPDQADLEAAAELGRRTMDKLAAGDRSAPPLPGARPYRDFQRADYRPEGDGRCVSCQACVEVCPVEAIPAADPKVTDGDRCIRCLACVRACPTGSRAVRQPSYYAVKDKLEGLLTKQARAPEYYI